MANKHIVCSLTSIILNDGVTLYPGYVEVKDGKLTRYDSDDPLNEMAKIKPWTLHNRVEYKYVALQKNCTEEKLQGKSFISEKAMEEYLTSK